MFLFYVFAKINKNVISLYAYIRTNELMNRARRYNRDMAHQGHFSLMIIN